MLVHELPQPQCIMTLPLLEGTGGTAKMSKSYGNVIGLSEPAAEMFGKVMSIPDQLMPKYLRLATDLGPAEVDEIAAGLTRGALHQGKTERRLAREIAALYHSPEAARAVEERFGTQFVARGIPEEVEEFSLGDADQWFLPSLLVESGLCPSSSDARRQVRARVVPSPSRRCSVGRRDRDPSRPVISVGALSKSASDVFPEAGPLPQRRSEGPWNSMVASTPTVRYAYRSASVLSEGAR
ncbi:MAG: hypothetical protein ACRD0K_14085 [Egibacteraceae bacterium]